MFEEGEGERRTRFVVQIARMAGRQVAIEFRDEQALAFIQLTEDAQGAGQLDGGAGAPVVVESARGQRGAIQRLRLGLAAGRVARAGPLEQGARVADRALLCQRVDGGDERSGVEVGDAVPNCGDARVPVSFSG